MGGLVCEIRVARTEDELVAESLLAVDEQARAGERGTVPSRDLGVPQLAARRGREAVVVFLPTAVEVTVGEQIERPVQAEERVVRSEPARAVVRGPRFSAQAGRGRHDGEV